MDAFGPKHADTSTATGGCFDRVSCKGYLPFGDDAYRNRFVDGALQVCRKDCYDSRGPHSDALLEHAQRQAERAGAPYRYRQGVPDKAKLIDQIIRERQCTEGRVVVLACQENCRTLQRLYGPGRPRRKFSRRPQRVRSYYFLDPDFGLLSIRLPSWFPFPIQVYVNGHAGLVRQLLQAQAGFVPRDNGFTQLDDPAQAHDRADHFPHLHWESVRRRGAERVHPLLRQDGLQGQDYRWLLDQAEYSTDVLFGQPANRAGLYSRLLEQAGVHFTPHEVMTFRGRKLHPQFPGEVQTRSQERGRGARVKHYVKHNGLKMYDPFGQVLRIETVINQPRAFKVRRLRTRPGCRRMVWCP